MGLYLNWFKSYDTNAKKLKKHYTNNKFFTELKKKMKNEIFASFEPITLTTLL